MAARTLSPSSVPNIGMMQMASFFSVNFIFLIDLFRAAGLRVFKAFLAGAFMLLYSGVWAPVCCLFLFDRVAAFQDLRSFAWPPHQLRGCSASLLLRRDRAQNSAGALDLARGGLRFRFWAATPRFFISRRLYAFICFPSFLTHYVRPYVVLALALGSSYSSCFPTSNTTIELNVGSQQNF